MIFLLTVVIWNGVYALIIREQFNSEDAQERPWMYGRGKGIRAMLGFLINLILSIIVGVILQKAS